MHKRLIQTGVLLVVSSQTMAYTLVDTDIATWTVYGTIKARAKLSDSKDNDYTFGDSEVGTRGRYAIFDMLAIAAGAEAEINLDRDETEDEDAVYMSEYYAGIYLESFGYITYGKHSTSSDDIPAVDFSEIYGGKEDLNAVGVKDETIKYVYSNEGVRLNATYGFSSGDNHRELKELYGSYQIEDLTLQAGIGNSKTDASTYKQNADYGTVSAIYALGDYNLGTTYYYNKTENQTNPARSVDKNSIAFAGELAFTPEITTYAGYEFIKHQSDTDSLDGNQQNIYLGAKYLIDDWIKLFAEVNYLETLTSGDEMNYGLGASVSF